MKLGDKVVLIGSVYLSPLLAPGLTGVITREPREGIFSVTMDNGHKPGTWTGSDDWSFEPQDLEVIE